MAGVECAYQFVQAKRGFPNFKQQGASRTGTADAAEPIDGGLVTFVAGATAVKLAGSDLQRFLSIH
jgi:hypothetical protein